MNALVLSGGSVKGAFQAGALYALLQRGFIPGFIWGVSVGALNGAFLADRAGRAVRRDAEPDWPRIGELLRDFWLDKVTRPSDIVSRRPQVEVAWKALLGRFDGFTNNAPLQALVRRNLNRDALRSSPVKFCAGVVNLTSGEFFNADTRYPDLVDYVLASAAIPLVMPLEFLDGKPLADGGVRDIAPLRYAIDAGATRIAVVACQAERLEAVQFKPRNLFSLAERVADILTDEILQNDLATAREINRFCPLDGLPATEGPYAGKRRVEVILIRPAKNPGIDILDFKSRDIRALVDQGVAAAESALDGSPVEPQDGKELPA